jgi:RNA polymerase sigma factor (sigma-70 family)
MRDTAVVESIVAGDSGGLAAAYDEYADLIYAYCRSMLSDPEETADAVQATFVNAAANAHRLHDAGRLRAWLFALARNQCMHGRRHAQAAVDTGALSMAVGNEADRAVLRAAIDGLSAGERDVLTLLWHGLDVEEAALILGLSRNDVYSRFSRARDQLETSVVVLLVCYHGRRDCAGLDDLLGDWDGYLTEQLRDQAAHHIQGCETCAGCRDRELRPALLLSLTPGALLGAAEEARAMARPAPPWLRDRLLWLVTTDDPQAEAERKAMDRRLAPFGNMGFPRPHRTRTWPPSLTRPRLVLGLAGGLAALAAIVALITIPGGTHSPVRTGADAAAGTGPSLQVGGAISPAATPAATPSASPSSGTASPTPSQQRTSAPASSATTSATAAPAISQAAAPPAAPQPSTPATSPVQGTLGVSPSSVRVVAPFASTITLTAHGGPVTWSVSVPSAAAGQLSVSPSSGTLSAGQSVTISVSARNANSFRTTLTFSPGGHQVAVAVGLG